MSLAMPIASRLASSLVRIGATLPAPAVKLEHFIVYGASIMDSLTSTEDDRADYEAKALAKVGYPVSVYDEAVYGWRLTDAVSGVNAMIARHADLPADNSVCVLLHLGGNDVSDNRPYTSAQDGTVVADMKTKLNTIIDAIEAKGWNWILADLTFRNYNGTTYGDATAELAGSLPYIERVHQVINAERHPQYTHHDGRSWADFYTLLWNNYDTWLSADNVHLVASAEAPFRQWIVDNVMHPLATGQAPSALTKDAIVTPPAADALLVGDVLVTSFGSSTKTASTNVNLFLGGDSPDGTTLATSLKRKADGLARTVSLQVVRRFNDYNNAGNSTLTALPHIAGPELAQSWFLGAHPSTGVTYDNAALLFSGLPAGSYEVTVTGSRAVASSDVNRITGVAIEIGTGDVLTGQYNAANPATGKEASRVILTVSPVNGQIQIAISRPDTANTAKYAYLGAIAIARIS